MKKKGLEPIIDSDTKILILGSLPGDESIKQQRYYAKPNNDFWKLISTVIREDITELDYYAKIKKLKKYRIGLWDVLKVCERKGSSDLNIKKGEMNDFSELKQIAPNTQLICFNGKKAGNYESFFQEEGYKTKVLPSSSGANRRDRKKRILEWKSIKPYI